MDFSPTLFRVRSTRLRHNANITLITIICVLAAGIAIFVFAGELANREASRSLLEARRKDLAAAEQRIDQVESYIGNNRGEIARLRGDLASENLGGRSGIPGKGPIVAELESRIRSAEDWEKELNGRLGGLEQRRAAARQALLDAEISGPPVSREAQTSTLISAIVTRTGSIVLLLFLVQILVPLYRYNLKLAAYYDARGDALEIWNERDGGSLEELEGLVGVLSPDTISFGHQPISPIEQAVDLAKHIVSTRGLK